MYVFFCKLKINLASELFTTELYNITKIIIKCYYNYNKCLVDLIALLIISKGSV